MATGRCVEDVRWYIVRNDGHSECGPYATQEAAEAKLPLVKEKYTGRSQLTVKAMDVNKMRVHPRLIKGESNVGI